MIDSLFFMQLFFAFLAGINWAIGYCLFQNKNVHPPLADEHFIY